MANDKYPKANKYPDIKTVYEQCSGPGGLKLAEFMAEKMGLQAGKRVLDVGFNRGYQTCFLAKEYAVQMVGIDPWDDRTDETPHVEYLMENARIWHVEDKVLAVKVGVPETHFADAAFDYVYASTTLEMLRGFDGEQAYLDALAEIYRVLRPGGVLGLSEPMHHNVEIPKELVPRVSQGPGAWTDFFVTLAETEAAVRSIGFEILEAEYAPDAQAWWEEFAKYDPFCRANPDGEPATIKLDGGRWLSFGYVIARKPA